ncbi:TIGR02680 family protein [Actinomadura harenae]|uniref:TIGR02680 family protein n=1 Tax=Actinomadura harenae TaxID=2483351 RepID=A0A3M2MCJ8_9ACTN|nr:TIGR02680 family protein [Actinomadura harenae]RMI47252.1 TIGR02680 family protein [Actinomadura harenae]
MTAIADAVPGPAGPADLPIARTSRWQPLRSGLVDLFYYDAQEFWFRDGRITFIGNNGTGKSKVLALTLPLLLDGVLTPSRVEPDGDAKKRMDWNLLLGGRYDERLGYTWLEFGRVTEDGEHAYLTVGIGLKAVAGRGITDHWFFLTSQRMGQDLFLIGPSGTTLTRDRLTEAIGPHGQVVQTAERYRRMLDEHLFRLGEERYDALVNLLIQLRQPQLSKRPDEKRLSKALSDALTPVDQAVLSDIATAFHDLEQQREELKGLRDTRRHVSRFLQRYRRYAQVAARRQGRELRTAHSAYENLQRSLSGLREEIAEARAKERQAGERIEASRTERAEQNAVREELGSDPRLKNLADAQRYAEQAEREAARARDTAERAGRTRNERQTRRDGAARSAESSAAALDEARGLAANAADRAGIAGQHAEIVLEPLNDEVLRRSEQRATAIADSRDEAIRHVTALAGKVTGAEAELGQARRILAEREADRDAAADALGEAQDTLIGRIGEHVAGWRDYGRSLAELTVPDPDDVGLADWAESLDGPHPLVTALRQAADGAREVLATARAEANARATGARTELEELTAERERLVSGAVERPPVPYTRGTGTRTGSGAALWQVVDFAPGLGPDERAGLEAALEASGLLDAWLTPDGRLWNADTHDMVALPGAPAARPLTGALTVAIDPDDAQAAALSPETVRAVLAGIGLGEQDAPAWVEPSGRWRVGPLRGAWAKDAAAHVGAGAREEARRRRLAELAELITAAEQSVADALGAVRRIDLRRQALEAELRREPSDQPLRDAHSAVTGAAGVLARAAERRGRAAEAVEWAEHDLSAALARRDQAAADLALPGDPAGLAEVSGALADYRRDMTGLLSTARRHSDRLAELRTWTEELASAAEAAAEAEETARGAGERAAEERGRLEALRASIGASVEELRDRLEQARRRIAELDRDIRELEGEHRREGERRARAQGREEQQAEQLGQAIGQRNRAVDELRRFADTGLFVVACDDLPIPDPAEAWAADPAVRLARRMEERLRDVEDGDEAWRRVQDEITRSYTDLNEALSRNGHHAHAGLTDWFVVTVTFQGRERTPTELTELLGGEVDYRERMLTAKERDLLEEHLVNDVASHLQELIGEAEEQVGFMNSELEERPTSTGMRLRLRWEALSESDGAPIGLAEARTRLLRQGSDLWSAADRAAVGDFLQREIERVRAADEHGTWQDHLREALDYRAWHRFVIERHQDGRWRSALGPASGGERVLTVSLPLFAAAAAHYRSAHPHAPRMVALDEAFAGVDDDARRKCLGLLTTFDLDVVMTSEREWGFYDTVPGLAAHQLRRRDGIDAVHVTTWEWDGSTPVRADRETRSRPPAARPSPEETNARPDAATDSDEDSLF